MSIKTNMTMPGQWIDADFPTPSITPFPPTFLTTSQTMEDDKSQPPTPDGTGLPTNFHLIGPGIYRSSYPQPAHFDQLLLHRFKTILTFVPEPIPAANLAFMTTHRITHHHIPVLANKGPHAFTPAATIHQILALMMDKRNHPLLIHCNKGKHRTGCVSACFRKVTGWTDDASIAEYERYSQPKDRELDKDFIRRFDAGAAAGLKSWALEQGFVGGAFAQKRGEEGSKDSEYTVGTVTSDQSRF